MKADRGVEVWLYSFLTPAVYLHAPAALSPGKEALAHTELEDGWATRIGRRFGLEPRLLERSSASGDCGDL